MMQLLLPLGLLGLLSILALILIYVIRPNYQVKHISSTYVWKLSLKRKRKRLPTSKIRNILIFLCQILILTAIALILADPSLVYSNTVGSDVDVIAIIDSSASMYTESNGFTRFQRALEDVRELTGSVLDSGGRLSVIIADDEPEFLSRRTVAAGKALVLLDLQELEEKENGCSYGSCDLDGAMKLCDEILAENPSAQIYFYTDTEYEKTPEHVSVMNVCGTDEWNAAILDAQTALKEGYYELTFDVGVYGMNSQVSVGVEIRGANALDANDEGSRIQITQTLFCADGRPVRVVFNNEGGIDEEDVVYYDLTEGNERFYSYQSIHISLSVEDSFSVDNDFYLYGGQKEVVKVAYESSDPNPFFTATFDRLRTSRLMIDRWDIQVTEIKKGEPYILEGYDFYFFEHKMPEALPMDGVVVLIDPDPTLEKIPEGAGFRVDSVENFRGNMMALARGEHYDHPIVNYFDPTNIEVSQIDVLKDCDPAYDVILTCDGNPTLIARNDGANKLAVLAFSVHYSNISMKLGIWYTMIYNMFEYFNPSTLSGNTFEVGESVAVNGRGPNVTISSQQEPLTEFPAELTLDLPGVYKIGQTSYFAGKNLPDINIFVKIPALESNILRKVESLGDYERPPAGSDVYDDLPLLCIAAALVALTFLEWWLQSRENR